MGVGIGMVAIGHPCGDCCYSSGGGGGGDLLLLQVVGVPAPVVCPLPVVWFLRCTVQNPGCQADDSDTLDSLPMPWVVGFF